MLITVGYYRLVTGDDTTADDEAEELITEATELLEDTLDRHLTSAQRTETVVIHPDGRAYPKAYPVTATTLELDPALDRRAFLSVDPDEVEGYFDTRWPPTATVTYTGGYTDDLTGVAPCPRPLARAVALLAAALRVPVSTGTAGAVSVSLGDASVTYARPLHGLDELVPGISATIRQYRRREYAA